VPVSEVPEGGGQGQQPQSWASPGNGGGLQDRVPQPQPQPPFAAPQYQQYQQPYGQQPGPQQWAMPQAPASAKSRTSGVRAAIIAGAGVVVIAAVVATVVFATKSTGSAPGALVVTPSSAAATNVAGTPSATAAAAAAPCSQVTSLVNEPVGYQVCGTAARNVGVPTFNAIAADKTYTVTIKTNRGDVVFTADGDAAPYTVYSFVYLVQKQYFDNTPCHRLTTTGIYVLQCGDPTGSGTGGPGYVFQDENLASLGTPGSGGSDGSVTYKAGTVAMANSGPDTNGSQFFLVYKDSPIAPDYTPFGTITEGLGVLQQIAAAGTNDANSTGDGAPLESVEIESVTVSGA
jgi:peptidyl-prolyl cis-trans isomerase B (cyclophilin B)